MFYFVRHHGKIFIQHPHDLVIFFLRFGKEGVGYGSVRTRGEFGKVDALAAPFFGDKILMPARHAYDDIRLFEAFGEPAPVGGGVLVQNLGGKSFRFKRGFRLGVQVFALVENGSALHPFDMGGKVGVVLAHTPENEFAVGTAADV